MAVVVRAEDAMTSPLLEAEPAYKRILTQRKPAPTHTGTTPYMIVQAASSATTSPVGDTTAQEGLAAPAKPPAEIISLAIEPSVCSHCVFSSGVKAGPSICCSISISACSTESNWRSLTP